MIDTRVGRQCDGTYITYDQTVHPTAVSDVLWEYPIENGVVRDWKAVETLW